VPLLGVCRGFVHLATGYRVDEQRVRVGEGDLDRVVIRGCVHHRRLFWSGVPAAADVRRDLFVVDPLLPPPLRVRRRERAAIRPLHPLAEVERELLGVRAHLPGLGDVRADGEVPVVEHVRVGEHLGRTVPVRHALEPTADHAAVRAGALHDGEHLRAEREALLDRREVALSHQLGELRRFVVARDLLRRLGDGGWWNGRRSRRDRRRLSGRDARGGRCRGRRSGWRGGRRTAGCSESGRTREGRNAQECST